MLTAFAMGMAAGLAIPGGIALCGKVLDWIFGDADEASSLVLTLDKENDNA